MPQAFYWLFVLLPKFGLWLAVAKSGVQYLMETAGIALAPRGLTGI